MARDFPGIPFSSIPDPSAPDFTPRLRNILGTIHHWASDQSQGMARINSGQVSNGSGTTLIAAPTDGDYGDVSVSGGGTVMTVDSAASTIYIQAGATAATIQVALDSLTTGGTVQLEVGDYTLTVGLTMSKTGLTLRGTSGPLGNTNLYYTADANTDIVTISAAFCTIENLTIRGSATYDNGYGAIGTGRGIVIAKTTAGDCYYPTIRNVEVANTGSWCIYDSGTQKLPDLGTGVSPEVDYGFDATHTSLIATGFQISTVLTLENVSLTWPNSGGCLYVGYGASAPRIINVKTNSYSFNTYTRLDSLPADATVRTKEKMGQFFFLSVADAYVQKCLWQSPAVQPGTGPVVHADVDATMISMLNTSPAHFVEPYFEILSAACGGGPGRTKWLVTSINSNGIVFDKAYGRSNVQLVGAGYPLRIMSTPADAIGNGVTWRDGRFFHFREVYTAGTAVLPYEAGDPSTIDRDDFVFGGFSDGEKESPIIVENCLVVNLTSGKVRECTTPASANTGYTIVSKQAVAFTSPAGPMMLARFDDSNPAGPGTPDDLRARAFSYHASYSGVMGYVRGTGSYAIVCGTDLGTPTTITSLALFGNVEVGNTVTETSGAVTTIPAGTYVTAKASSSSITVNNAVLLTKANPPGISLTFTINGTSQREGLWLCSNRGGPDFRQIPYIRTYTTEMPGKLAGDLWMQLSGTVVSSVYPTAQFKWYDGAAWQAPLNRSLGTAAGDLIKYTASDTPARLAIGSTGQVLAVSGGAPVWGANVVMTQDAAGSTVPLSIIADNTPTANLTEWKDSASTVVASMGAAGGLTCTGSSSFVETSGLLPSIDCFVSRSATYDGLGLILNDAIVGSFKGEICVVPAGLTANRAYTFPDATGDVVISGSSATLVAGSSSTLSCTSQTIGTSFTDSATPTKKLRFILSGAGGNNVITLVNTAARIYTLPDTAGTMVLVGNQAAAADKLGKITLTGQTGSLAAQTLVTASANAVGMHRVSLYLTTTTIGDVADNVTLTLAWNDGAAQTMVVGFLGTTSNILPYTAHDLRTANAFSEATVVVRIAASTAITFTTTLTSPGAGTPAYSIDARIEALG